MTKRESSKVIGGFLDSQSIYTDAATPYPSPRTECAVDSASDFANFRGRQLRATLTERAPDRTPAPPLRPTTPKIRIVVGRF